jgi:peptide/nickel transport system permease protein
MKRFAGFFTRRQNLLGLAIVFFFIVLAVGAPYLAPLPLEFSSPGWRMLPTPPGALALLGTLPVGAGNIQMDVYKMIVWGSNSALRFGLIVSVTTNLFGLLVGAASAYFGGWINNVAMRVTDAFLTFPVIAGVALFQSFYFSSDSLSSPTPIESLLRGLNLDPLLITLVLFSWMPAARLTNSIVLQIKKDEFFEAAMALGASPPGIILRHIIPNSIQPAVVLAARDIGLAVVIQAGFTFIGLTGGTPWGDLLSASRRWIIARGGNILIYWWVFLPVTLAIILFGIGWNLLGDGLNDWFSPQKELSN